jgi:hypothetical protein
MTRAASWNLMRPRAGSERVTNGLSCTRRTDPRPVRRGNATNRSPLEGMDET